jgi:hypothetical protein
MIVHVECATMINSSVTNNIRKNGVPRSNDYRELKNGVISN